MGKQGGPAARALAEPPAHGPLPAGTQLPLPALRTASAPGSPAGAAPEHPPQGLVPAGLTATLRMCLTSENVSFQGGMQISVAYLSAHVSLFTVSHTCPKAASVFIASAGELHRCSDLQPPEEKDSGCRAGRSSMSLPSLPLCPVPCTALGGDCSTPGGWTEKLAVPIVMCVFVDTNSHLQRTLRTLITPKDPRMHCFVAVTGNILSLHVKHRTWKLYSTGRQNREYFNQQNEGRVLR